MADLNNLPDQIAALPDDECQKVVDIISGAVTLENLRRAELFTEVPQIIDVERAKTALTIAKARGIEPSEWGPILFIMNYQAAIGEEFAHL